MLDFQSLFNQFCKEKLYLQNVSQHTLEFYKYSFKAFNLTEPLTKSQLTERVTSMREAGKTAACVDAYTRGINSFLTWLYTEGHISEPLKVKRAKLEKRVMQTFNDKQLQAIISYKPKDKYELRTYHMMLIALDTGARINELLTLTRDRVDLENFLITVLGKGNKQRTIPISVEGRKVLYKCLREHKFSLVFCTRYGGKILYNNTRRDFNRLLENAGVSKCEGSWHSLRRFFATNYIRSNGNPLKLQRMLGHTTLKQTQEYVKLVTEDLQEEQQRTSVLSRMR